MKKKKVSHRTPTRTAIQPSWSGIGTSHSADSTSKSRINRWLCSSDNKCVPYEETSFTENMNWRIFRIMAEFVEGFEFLSKLKREVSVFGSARATGANKYYQLAKDLGYKCAKGGFTIVTGGGPGIMEAANWGAFDGGGDSVGIDISLPMEQRKNQYVRRSMSFHYFFTRKVMLSASSQAYIFFPGGFGTLDEMFEIITLIQTKKISAHVPVILFGRQFWQPMLAWVNTTMWEEHRFIEKEEMEIIHLVDTVDEAYQIIKKTHERLM